MDPLIKEFFPTAGLAATLAGAVLALTRWLNNTVAERVKSDATGWILGTATRPDWAKLILSCYDALLIGRTFSPWFIWRVFAVVSAIGMIAFFWSGRSLLIAFGVRSHEVAPLSDWLVAFGLLSLFSLPAQLLLVPMTRSLLKLLFKKPWWWIATAVLLQIVLVEAVTITWGFVTYAPEAYCDSDYGGHFCAILQPYFDFVPHVGEPRFYTPIFIANHVTFIWMLVALSLATLRGLPPVLSKTTGRLARWVRLKRIEEEPISLLGEVLAAFVFAVIFLGGVIVAYAT